MPRYDFFCKRCERETTVFTPEDRPIHLRSVKCEHCGKNNLELVAYYYDDKTLLYAIQYQIDSLIAKVDTIIEKLGPVDED